MKKRRFIIYVRLIGILFLLSPFDNSMAENFFKQHAGEKQTEKNIPKYPIGFEENKGQFADEKGNLITELLFKASVADVDVYVTTKGISYFFKKIEEEDDDEREEKRSIEWCRMDMNLSGANIARENIVMEQEVQGYSNYYLSHCPNGVLNVKKYNKISIKNIYPGIDWVLYSDKNNSLKYDFVVHPGSDPSAILLEYKGAGKIESSGKGSSLLIKTPFGELKEGEVLSYEKGTDQKNLKNISSRYDVKGKQVRFLLNDYDKTKTLVIDPPMTLIWATYYGGNWADGPRSSTLDVSGNLYITGYTGSSAFPLYNPGGGAYYQGTLGSSFSVFVLKFNSSGVQQWATYLGGTDNNNQGQVLTTDASGNLFVLGKTQSAIFPTLNPGGGAYYDGTFNGGEDAFISKFNSSGVMSWSTYYGGTSSERPYAATVDGAGNLFVAGFTYSSNFPTLNPGGSAYYDGTNGGGQDIFIMEFNSAGAQTWATYYGGIDSDIARDMVLDGSGNLFVTGETSSKETTFSTLSLAGAYNDVTHNDGGGSPDVFILKFNSALTRMWATFYGGGGGSGKADVAYGIATDASSNIYITGYTYAANFPTLNPGAGAYFQGVNGGGSDAFIAKFSSTGAQVWSTYYGGSLDENTSGSPDLVIIGDIGTDAAGEVFVAGHTASSNFPVFNPADGSYFDGTFNGGVSVGDVFILRFSSTGVSTWATYYGGNGPDWGNGISVDASGYLYLTGESTSTAALPLVDPGGGAYYQSIKQPDDEGLILRFGPPIVLPIELTSFKSKCTTDDKVLLEWQTASETRNDHFTLQRSSDGYNYETILNVKGAGNSNSILNYSAIDIDPLAGINYYRLMQTDFDKQFQHSGVTVINMSDCNKKISSGMLYPNPASNELNYAASSSGDGNINITVIDMIGKIVLEQEFKNDGKGSVVYTIDISTLSKGIYILEAGDASERKQFKFIKQ